MSDEARAAIGKAHLGNQYRVGFKASLETRAKQSELKRGKVFSEATRQKIREAHLGRSFSAEHRSKLSQAHKGRVVSEETRNKMAEAHRGEKSHLWKGGVTAINRIIRTSSRYRRWRQAVLRRDDHTCVECGAKEDVMHADHIKPFSVHADLRFELDNGRTLCADCHKQTDTYGEGAKRYKRTIDKLITHKPPTLW